MFNPKCKEKAKPTRIHSAGHMPSHGHVAYNLVELCDATARITKILLALGAENNWEDIQQSQGRSMLAGMYRSNWLYLSRHDRGEYTDPPKLEKKSDSSEAFLSEIPQTLFYYTPKTESKTHKNYVARNAAAAVLSLTGACDQHAFVLATLLRAILPKGTAIHICGLDVAQESIPHTFVVVGNLPNKKYIHLNDLLLHRLLAVDAWTTIGGAVALNNYFLSSGNTQEEILIVDKTFIADGKDHLIKRIRKQKILYDIINEDEMDITVQKSSYLSSFIHHELGEQVNYTKQIKRDKYLANSPYDYESVYDASTISIKYKQPERSKEVFEYICKNYPHAEFMRCLEYVSEQVNSIVNEDRNHDADFTHRLNTF
ncbi:Uncharacterised protein [Legionella wadsworthii]|uniref:Uncharacterized protein n=1 Tax=Legionella wadsworthii TaxID=28088 RepID=A0A378LWJ2_9GAMM|nr:hypothetical protein [Legionella wadsworthii]STY30356.1 Uncharacterised protein [Legionella wadsworthii]